MKRTLLAAAFMIGSACALYAQRTERTLEKGWKFTKGDIEKTTVLTENHHPGAAHPAAKKAAAFRWPHRSAKAGARSPGWLLHSFVVSQLS